LQVQFGKAPEVKTFGASEIKITTDYMINEKGPTVDSLVEARLFEGLKPILPQGTDFDGFMKNHITSIRYGWTYYCKRHYMECFISVVLALLFIFLYIFVRFRNWQFGMGAVAALSTTCWLYWVYSLFFTVLFHSH
jgi:SecD/SecF fusion protein